MSIVVTTPTGNIGSKLTNILLDNSQDVVIVARKPEKVAHFKNRGARVFSGTHADPKVLLEATKGARALFLLAPPDPSARDLRAHYRAFASAAAEAIVQNRVEHVVHLSSMGADLDSGTGPVLGLHDNEQILTEAAKNIVHLRAAYFMENTLMQIDNIKQDSALFTPLSGSLRIPMIATRDIADRAADFLETLDWRGRIIVELHGPDEVSYDDVARALSETLGKKIEHLTVSQEQAEYSLRRMGMSPEAAHALCELFEALETQRASFGKPNATDSVTPTSYPVFAQEVFKPIYELKRAR